MEVDVNELDSEELGRRLIPKPEMASKITSNGKLDVASSRDDAAIDDSGCETTSNLTLEIRKGKIKFHYENHSIPWKTAAF